MPDPQPTLSRVADALYWMSRYLERAEHHARLLDVHLNLMIDTPAGVAQERRLANLLDSLAVTEPIESPSLAYGEEDDAEALVRRLTFDSAIPASVMATITTARENARQVREQTSSEMWMQMNKLYLHVKQAHRDGDWQAIPHEFYLEVKEGSHLFQGISDATMNHNQGWHFIQIGRYVERIFGLLQLLDVHFGSQKPRFQDTVSTDRYFELVAILKSVTAFEAYCKVYTPDLQPMWIVEFLLFNSDFPRSLRFCVEMILHSLSALADATGRSKNTRLYRLAGRLESRLAFDEISDVDNLHDYVDNIREQIRQIHETAYDTFISYPIESAL